MLRGAHLRAPRREKRLPGPGGQVAHLPERGDPAVKEAGARLGAVVRVPFCRVLHLHPPKPKPNAPLDPPGATTGA